MPFVGIQLKTKVSLKRVLNELYFSISLTINFCAAQLQFAILMLLPRAGRRELLADRQRAVLSQGWRWNLAAGC